MRLACVLVTNFKFGCSTCVCMCMCMCMGVCVWCVGWQITGPITVNAIKSYLSLICLPVPTFRFNFLDQLPGFTIDLEGDHMQPHVNLFNAYVVISGGFALFPLLR